MARKDYSLGTAAAGDVAKTAMETGKGNYLANLVLYPGEHTSCAVCCALACLDSLGQQRQQRHSQRRA
jgi:hypothetical protein